MTKNQSKRWMLIALGSVILLTQCAPWLPWIRKQDRIRVTEQRLISETDTLLSISPTENPEEYRRQTQEFEQLLSTYLELTATDEEKVLVLESENRIYVLPIAFQQPETGKIQARLSTEPLRIIQYTGSPLHTEPLAVHAQKSTDAGYRILMAFENSVGLYTLSRSELTAVDNAVINPGEIRSLKPSAIILADSTGRSILHHSEILHPAEVITTGDSLQLNLIDNDRGSLYSPNIEPVPGRGAFRIPETTLSDFRSMQSLPGTSYLVTLDERGYLHLVDQDTLHSLWRSQRPWGHRVFPVDSAHVGVINTAEDAFILFERRGTTFTFLGTSHKFPGLVTGLTHLDRNTFFGIVKTPGKREAPDYRALIAGSAPDQLDSTGSYLQPEFPDYGASLTFFLSAGMVFPDFHGSQSYLQLWEHIYETPVSESGREINLHVLRELRHNQNLSSWTLVFRDDLHFSDGSRADANTIAKGWIQTWKACSDQNCSLQWLWQDIEGVKSLDSSDPDSVSGIEIVNSRTLRITLHRSHPDFPYYLTKHPFAIRKIGTESSFAYGTGSYGMNRRKRGAARDSLDFNRVENHSGLYPPLESIQFRTPSVNEIPPANPGTGVITPRNNVHEYLQQFNNLHTEGLPVSDVYYLVFNPERPYLSGGDARRDVAKSLDREVTAEIITDRRCEPRGSFISERRGTTDQARSGEIEISRAAHIAYRKSDPVAQHIAERLAVRLEQRGLDNRQPRGLSDQSFYQLRATGRYDILVDSNTPAWQSARMQLIHLVRQGYVLSPSLQKAFQRASAAPEDIKADNLEALLLRENILYPVLATRDYLILPDALRNVRISTTGSVDFSGAWFSH